MKKTNKWMMRKKWNFEKKKIRRMRRNNYNRKKCGFIIIIFLSYFYYLIFKLILTKIVNKFVIIILSLSKFFLCLWMFEFFFFFEWGLCWIDWRIFILCSIICMCSVAAVTVSNFWINYLLIDIRKNGLWFESHIVNSF